MRNPVKGGRYTSGFGPRVHPLLGITRMHTGVDWAAPDRHPDPRRRRRHRRAGRPPGRLRQLRPHPPLNGFSTAYGHMSRYADGLEPGMSVKQGQVIGYVGSTGFSTGPHCHYEILVNNKFVNPMTIQVPRGLQLTGRQLASFQKERNRIDELRAARSGHRPRRPGHAAVASLLFLFPSFLLLPFPPPSFFVLSRCARRSADSIPPPCGEVRRRRRAQAANTRVWKR